MGVDVEMLKGARVQRLAGCTLVYCVEFSTVTYILWFSRVQLRTLCTLALLVYLVEAGTPSEPGTAHPSLFRPCRPAVAGQPNRPSSNRAPSGQPPNWGAQRQKRGCTLRAQRRTIFLFCKSQPHSEGHPVVLSYRNPPVSGGQAEPLSDVVGRRKSGLTPAPTQVQNHFMKGEIT